MAIPPLGSSLDCTGITGSVRDQTLRGETASASGSDPVSTVATRTFSGAGAEADAASLPPPESGTVPGAEESTKQKIYRLLESDEICEQILRAFRVSYTSNRTTTLIHSLANDQGLEISRVAFSKLFRAGRAILSDAKQKNSYFVDVARRIIRKVGKGRTFEVVPTTLAGILEASPSAMSAIKAGVDAKCGNKIILKKIKNILREERPTLIRESSTLIPESSFDALITTLKFILRNPTTTESKTFSREHCKNLYPLAQKIAQIDNVRGSESVKLVPTTSSAILEGSTNAMRALKAGVDAEKSYQEIVDTVKVILEAEGYSKISENYLKKMIVVLRAVLINRTLAKQKKSTNRDYKRLLPLAEKIAQINTSSAPKRARETSDVLSEAGARAGAGGENISSKASGSTTAQEERASKRARTTSPDLPPSELLPVPDEKRTGDLQSAEDPCLGAAYGLLHLLEGERS